MTTLSALAAIAMQSLIRRVVCLNFDNSGNIYWIVVDLNIYGKNHGKGTTGVPAKPKVCLMLFKSSSI